MNNNNISTAANAYRAMLAEHASPLEETHLNEGKILNDEGKSVENMQGALVKKIADAIDNSGFFKKHLVLKGIPGKPEIRGYCYGMSHEHRHVGISLMLQQEDHNKIEVFVDYKFAKVEIYEYDPDAKAAAARWADELENRKRFA